ncbi:MAG: DUF262 domain-containing protein [Sphingobacteriaceae bacterium]|nr:DUF262 domain-containing protein [Sphingobacteriaceae bacterium]
MNITPNKLTISQLFATNNEQFIVPSYQRRYAWGYNQYVAVYEDIDMLKDNDGHLFGMIILHTHPHTAGLNQPELVDGQQRMTTLVILLKAFETVYRAKKKEEKANEIKKMILSKGLDEIDRPKIKLGDLDNHDIEQLVLKNKTDNITNKNIKAAYDDYVEWLSELEIEPLNKLFFKLTNVAVIIRLDVTLAKDAYKLFETINNRGLKLTPTDIIKNFLLGHAAKINQKEVLDEVKLLWSQIIINLNDIDTDDFLRHFICSTLQRKVTKSALVYEFKRYYLKNVENADLLGEFEYYQDMYDADDDEYIEENEVKTEEKIEDKKSKEPKFSITSFLENLKDLSEIYRKISFAKHELPKINRSISNLNNILSKPSYIFLMHFLLNEKHVAKEKLAVLKFIETLMLRRHICERRTSENDDIFSKLVSFVGEENILSNIKEFIMDEEYMPNDNEFEESFPKHQFKGRLIDRAKYVLETIEYHERGNTSELLVSSSEEVHLEHIIPQTINTKKSKEEFGDWVTYLGDKSVAKHKKYVNYIGNMTLLGESLNIQAYNNPFAKKKNSYKKSSFLITQGLANQNDFKFSHVDRRGEELTALALRIWKY